MLTAIDGRVPQSAAHARRILQSYQSGEKLTLQVLRQRKARAGSIVTMPADEPGPSVTGVHRLRLPAPVPPPPPPALKIMDIAATGPVPERPLSRADFHFDLPPELIAQRPGRRRGASRLLVLDGASGAARSVFTDLPIAARTRRSAGAQRHARAAGARVRPQADGRRGRTAARARAGSTPLPCARTLEQGFPPGPVRRTAGYGPRGCRRAPG